MSNTQIKCNACGGFYDPKDFAIFEDKCINCLKADMLLKTALEEKKKPERKNHKATGIKYGSEFVLLNDLNAKMVELTRLGEEGVYVEVLTTEVVPSFDPCGATTILVTWKEVHNEEEDVMNHYE